MTRALGNKGENDLAVRVRGMMRMVPSVRMVAWRRRYARVVVAGARHEKAGNRASDPRLSVSFTFAYLSS